MRYFIYLVLYLILQFITYLITPLLPLFATMQDGPCDNNSEIKNQPRLPRWLNWFMTPDNSLWGDGAWYSKQGGAYWSQVAWLYRNSLYGFKWSVLAAPASSELVFQSGNKAINYKGPVYGTLECLSGEYWQHKSVSHLFGDYCLVLNFGWLIEDGREIASLFMFSPRIKKVEKYDGT